MHALIEILIFDPICRLKPFLIIDIDLFLRFGYTVLF